MNLPALSIELLCQQTFVLIDKKIAEHYIKIMCVR